MKAWMRSIADWMLPGLARSSARRAASANRPPRPRRTRARFPTFGPGEALEGRSLMAVTGVTPFATLPGTLTSTNQVSQVSLTIAPGTLSAAQATSAIVGFVVEAADGSTANPKLTKLVGAPAAQIKQYNVPAHGSSPADRLARQTHLFAKVTPSTSQAETITLNVAPLNKRTGNYIVEAYLAGDIDGNGSVDYSDLNAIQAAYGSRSGQANYNPAADINGDGRVGCIDRTLLTMNMGARFTAPVTAATTPAATTVPTAAATPTPATAPVPIVPTAATTSVPLATPSPSVSLVPTATPAPTVTAAAVATTPVAVATPVAIATPVSTTTTTVPVTTTTVPVATTTANVPVTLTPTTALPVATTAATATTGYVAGTTATPVYLIAQPAGTVAATPGTTTAPVYLYGGTPGAVAATPATAAAPVYLYGGTPTAVATTPATTTTPVYVYGQPVVGGATSTGATLFGQTPMTTPAATASTVPVYLYSTPNYSAGVGTPGGIANSTGTFPGVTV